MSEKQSRLAGIQDMVLNSTKDTFFDQTIVLDLLAVVKAESAGLTPKQVVGVYAYSLGLEADSAIKEELRQKRIAWEAIA